MDNIYQDCAASLLEVVPRVMRTVRLEMRKVAAQQFTVPQFRVLNQLRKAPRTNRELAEWMGVAAPTMSRLVDTLERKKVIQRRPLPSDQRVQTITLTPRGAEDVDRIRLAVRKSFEEILKVLNQRQVASLRKGVHILGDLFE